MSDYKHNVTTAEEEFRPFNLQSPGSYNEVRDEDEKRTQTGKSALQAMRDDLISSHLLL